MIIMPRIRNNICLSAHPDGCAANVRNQIEYVKNQKKITGKKRILIIGSSTGYGLSCRIVSAFGYGARTIGVAYEKEGSEKSPGTAGWYNTIAFENEAASENIESYSINGDAFSNEIKKETIDLIKRRFGKIDQLIYSVAAPVRTDPVSKKLYSSVIKPIGKKIKSRSLDFLSGVITEKTIEPATEEEIRDTVKVMGGEDWSLWIQELINNNLLARGFTTVAFSYLGPELTRPFYREGTIGRAKEDLERTAGLINKKLGKLDGKGIVSINKALVTRASAVIPMVSLYISILYKIMKKKGIHENCIQQSFRLYRDYLSCDNPLQGSNIDTKNRIRLDDFEMRGDVQEEISEIWKKINNENLSDLADLEGYKDDYLKFFGFNLENIDYDKSVRLAI